MLYQFSHVDDYDNLIEVEILYSKNEFTPVSAGVGDRKWEAHDESSDVPFWVLKAFANFVAEFCRADNFIPIEDLDADDLAALAPWLGDTEGEEG